MARVERFEYKFPGMRKADSFIVYPRKSGDDAIIVQGSRTIARIEGDGTGMINYKGTNPKYFLHLTRMMGAEPIEFPRDFLALVIEFMPKSGDLIGSSPVTGQVYLA